MKTNIEIEFKTFISKEIYDQLLALFQLENNIFTQINHYFDTEDFLLQQNDTILRIRQKHRQFKLTSKSHGQEGVLEKHILLQEPEAMQMLKQGFDATMIDIPYPVKKICELTTERASTAYKNGILFLDKSSYYGNVDYEVEFEADAYEQGLEEFQSFLEEYQIPYQPAIQKSKRAFLNRPK